MAGSVPLVMIKPLYLQVFLSSCNHTVVNGLRLTVLLYAAYLQASPAVIGLLAASFGLISAFMAVGMGRWIDRIGPKQPFMLASLVIALCGVLVWAVEGLAVLFVICPLVGIFNSLFQIGSHQVMGRFGKPEDRTANFTVHALGISAATFIGPMVSGLSVDHLGHLNSFLLLGILSAVPLAVLASNLLIYPPQAVRKRDSPEGSKGGWSMLRDADLRRAYVTASMNNCLWSLVSFMIPLYGTQIGLSATRIGTLMAILASGTVGIRVVMPWMIRNFRRWPLVMGAQLSIVIGFVGMPFTEIYWAMGVLACFIGMGLGLSGPVTTTLMYDASPPERVGEVVGMRMTVANAGQTVVPLFAGAVGAAFGVGPVFWFVAALVLGDVYSNRDMLVDKDKPKN